MLIGNVKLSGNGGSVERLELRSSRSCAGSEWKPEGATIRSDETATPDLTRPRDPSDPSDSGSANDMPLNWEKPFSKVTSSVSKLVYIPSFIHALGQLGEPTDRQRTSIDVRNAVEDWLKDSLRLALNLTRCNSPDAKNQCVRICCKFRRE